MMGRNDVSICSVNTTIGNHPCPFHGITLQHSPLQVRQHALLAGVHTFIPISRPMFLLISRFSFFRTIECLPSYYMLSYSAAILAYSASMAQDGFRPPLTTGGTLLAKDPSLAALVARAWAPDPGDRPTMAQVLEELQRLAAGEAETGR